MNASIRSFFVFIFLLLLLPTVEASAKDKSSARGSKANRYSIVEEYKGAYAKPRTHRNLFGKRKPTGRSYARTHRTHSW